MALAGADLTVEPGERVAIVGPSGSGKTTLLYCLAGILEPTRGQVVLHDQMLSDLSADERAAVRLECFGFVFQFAELVPELSLRENVELPLRLAGKQARTAGRRASELLELLGLMSVAHRRPGQVSGGQAQRCAVARALAPRPAVVFADEPTGALDAANGRVALSELVRLSQECETALVVVTHDAAVAEQLERRVDVCDGRCRPVSA